MSKIGQHVLDEQEREVWDAEQLRAQPAKQESETESDSLRGALEDVIRTKDCFRAEHWPRQQDNRFYREKDDIVDLPGTTYTISGVHRKLQEARIQLQNKTLTKTGYNSYSQYYYFELSDFLPTVQEIFKDLGLCGVVSFTSELASLTITDIDTGSSIVITSPMGSAALKGMHEIQNIGATETYQRRYLWVTAMEIVENDAIDASNTKKTQSPTDGANKGIAPKRRPWAGGRTVLAATWR